VIRSACSYGREPRSLTRRTALGVGAVGAFILACGGKDEKGKGGAAATPGVGAAGASTQAETPTPGGIISQRLQMDPPSLDLHQVTTYQGVWPTTPCFNQLVQYDAAKPTATPENVVADLAEKWEQPDATTLVFNLKKGIKFHDGGDLAAEDVSVQFEWIKKAPQGKTSIRAPRMQVVESIEAPDAGTVRLKLSRPSPSLLPNLASHFFTIGQAKDIVANGEIGPKLIGTGPFKLKNYQRGNLLELEKNPAYHVPGRPYLDGLRFYFLPDYTTALANFIAGQYQMFFDLQFLPNDAQRLKNELGDKVETVEAPGTLRDLVYTNTRRKPFDDVRVRRAISLALDRDAAITVVKQGGALRGGYMTPKGVWAIPESELRKYDGYDKSNVDQAKQLLAQAGAGGQMDVTATPRMDVKDTAEFVKDQVAKIGFNLKILLGDIATTQPQMQRGEFDISPWVVGIDTDDPDATFAELATSNAVRNWSAVKDPQIDALYEKQSQTVDFNERKKLVQDLERLSLSLYQASVLYFGSLNFAHYKSVRNFVYHESLYTNRRMEAVWLKR
jgi:peptide/nickel transport system substrate-binding protein